MNKGNNLYPQELTLSFGDVTISLDVPEGVWNPTPHGMHLGNMILNLDFKGADVLELGSGYLMSSGAAALCEYSSQKRDYSNQCKLLCSNAGTTQLLEQDFYYIIYYMMVYNLKCL